ncbi:MAG: hypothetical protein EZS28_003628 [Streblomastix strix]|uniref:Uncharacterized protein n=1 Tax=Streblomastix strix TaxID=222440 RepID=A0A5J4X196_9EUKA|nr:MAG: hypothetical protein EZS28_003628 [Streblomastix strix]
MLKRIKKVYRAPKSELRVQSKNYVLSSAVKYLQNIGKRYSGSIINLEQQQKASIIVGKTQLKHEDDRSSQAVKALNGSRSKYLQISNHLVRLKFGGQAPITRRQSIQ